MNVPKLWHRLFLEERPSIGLSFFRIFVALTIGFHVIPTFFHLDDNFLSTAFKLVNGNFFTSGALEIVAKSPDWLVIAFVIFFIAAWFCFLADGRIGIRAFSFNVFWPYSLCPHPDVQGV